VSCRQVLEWTTVNDAALMYARTCPAWYGWKRPAL
jgi:hypothetical protein